MNLWSNITHWYLVDRSLRFVFMKSNVKSFISKNCLAYNAGIWGHVLSKKKSLINTTNKAQNSPTLTQ